MDYCKQLITNDLADKVLEYKELDSTMLELERLRQLTGSESRLLVVTKTQIAGIGRGENKWYSPAGGLWFSYLLPLPELYPSLTLYLGSVIHRVLSELFPQLIPDLKIKWTNDIYFGNRKLCGILVRRNESSYQIGIGINTNPIVDNALETLCAISLQEILGFEVDHGYLLYKIIKAINTNLHELESQSNFISYCNAHLYGVACEVEVNLDTKILRGKLSDIDSDGSLRIETGNNTREKAYFASLNVLFT